MIQFIPKEAFAQTSTWRGIILPDSVDWYCPHCGRRVNFKMNWTLINNPQSVLFCNSACSGCRKLATFIYIGFKENNNDPKEGELFIHPEPRTRSPLDGIFDSVKFNGGLKEAYESSINVYNVGEWTATAVLCRRLLEGITMQILPDEKKKLPLGKQLQELPNHIDLQKPLLTLADALRKGGNIGAHFDLEKTPNENIITLMMDLLDYLIEYIYILPSRIDDLHKKIEELSNK
ncbi:MAG: DUF4145 domain-containing protein [Bacteroidales bacterium]|nr:DUF4145 domain-containing protein [Bacteroidales bacterium]